MNTAPGTVFRTLSIPQSVSQHKAHPHSKCSSFIQSVSQSACVIIILIIKILSISTFGGFTRGSSGFACKYWSETNTLAYCQTHTHNDYIVVFIKKFRRNCCFLSIHHHTTTTSRCFKTFFLRRCCSAKIS